MPTPADLEIIEVDLADDELLGRWLAIHNRIETRQLTVAGFRAELTAALEHLEVLAILDGVDVGAAGSGWGTIMAESGETIVETWVLPESRRQGIGTTLVERIVRFATDHGMTTGRAHVTEGDDDAIRFAARYGLTPIGAGQQGFLDLTPAHATTEPVVPTGVELTTLTERPDLARAVYDLDVLVQPEVPSLAVMPTPTYEAWRTDTVDDTGFVSDLSVLALRDATLVGTIHIYDNAEGTAMIGMAAVDPGSRRQGIARALKVELARRAASSGWKRIETYNDGENERMRALNLELGYVYLPRQVNLRGQLRMPDPTPSNG